MVVPLIDVVNTEKDRIKKTKDFLFVFVMPSDLMNN